MCNLLLYNVYIIYLLKLERYKMFPKKRKQKENHITQAKFPKKTTDSEYINPKTPIPRPASPTLSVYSDYGESSVYSPPSSRPATPKGDPIISDKDTLILFGDQKSKKKEVSLSNDYINNDTEIDLLNQLDSMDDLLKCPPTPAMGPASPTFSLYSEFSERCDSPNIYDIPKTPSDLPNSPIASGSKKMSLSSNLSRLNTEVEDDYPTPESPIDFNNLEKYVNLASPLTINWEDTETFISDTPQKPSSSDDLLFKVPYPVAPNMIPVVAKITYESVFDCNKDGSQLTYFIPVNREEAVGYIDQEKTLPVDGEVQLEESLLSFDDNITSDKLFNMMCYISDCENKRNLLNINVFKGICNHEGLIHTFNFSMKDIINNGGLEGQIIVTQRATLTRSIVCIFNHLKSLYLDIYPARQILEQIKASPTDLVCGAMLYHEDKSVVKIVRTIKKYLKGMGNKPPVTRWDELKREENIRKRISVLAESYKKLYNL